MSAAPVRPAGAGLPPPTDLLDRRLPLRRLARGMGLYRVHHAAHAPIFFGPGAGRPPTFRFDAASGRFGVLYVAEGRAAPLIETLLRNPQQLSVSRSQIEARAMSRLSAARRLSLVDATGANLSRLGATAELFTGAYDVCGRWSDALWDHPQRPDGILYPSRHDPGEECIALFQRGDLVLTVEDTKPLMQLAAEIARVLDAHGKSLM